jgi:hypothetical protein
MLKTMSWTVILSDPLVILSDPLVILSDPLVILSATLVILSATLVILSDPLVILIPIPRGRAVFGETATPGGEPQLRHGQQRLV